MFNYINPVRIIILLTFVVFLFVFDKRKKVHLLLMTILLIAVCNETLTIVFRINKIPHQLNNSVYTIVTQLMWLVTLGHLSQKTVAARWMVGVLLIFAIVNLTVLQGISAYNSFTFILGAFLYVSLFVWDCYTRLKNEEVAYFSSGEYILAIAPLLFFIGFSILFGFQNKALHDTIFFGVTLFKLVCYFINVIYYLLIALYIVKNSRTKVYA